MHYAQTFIIDRTPLGSLPRREVYVHGDPSPPTAYAFFCPYCGEIWARTPVGGEPFHSLTRPCIKHPHQASWSPSGSIWVSWDEDYLLALPRKVLEREFQIMLNLFEEKEQNHGHN